MIPQTIYEPDLLEELKVVRQPSLGWGIDFTNNRIIKQIDGVEAVKQAAYLILSCERYSKEPHTWNYGIETYDLYQKNKFLIIPQLQKRIMDALYQDDRITDIKNFVFDTQRDVYHVTFDIETIYGETATIDTEVTI